ncbi:transposase [Paraburkholderia sediminicola]
MSKNAASSVRAGRSPCATLLTKGWRRSDSVDYNLKRSEALTRNLDRGHVPIDNNRAEDQTRPWVIARANRLFASLLRAGPCAASIMSLIRWAQLSGHEPHLI